MKWNSKLENSFFFKSKIVYHKSGMGKKLYEKKKQRFGKISNIKIRRVGFQDNKKYMVDGINDSNNETKTPKKEILKL